jgi:DNA-binding NtrC family response regulator
MERLLIVEDDPGVGLAFEMALQDLFEIRRVHGGMEAMAVCPDFLPQVVLLDYRMAGLNGTQTLERLLTLSRRPHVVLCSGYVDLRLARQAMQLGASDCLPKPCDRDLLRARLKAVVSSPLPARRISVPFSLRMAGELEGQSDPGLPGGFEGKRLQFQATLLREALSECHHDHRRAAAKLRLGEMEFEKLVEAVCGPEALAA